MNEFKKYLYITFNKEIFFLYTFLIIKLEDIFVLLLDFVGVVKILFLLFDWGLEDTLLLGDGSTCKFILFRIRVFSILGTNWLDAFVGDG